MSEPESDAAVLLHNATHVKYVRKEYVLLFIVSTINFEWLPTKASAQWNANSEEAQVCSSMLIGHVNKSANCLAYCT